MGIQVFPPISKADKILTTLKAYKRPIMVYGPPPSSNWATLLDISGTSGFCTTAGVRFGIYGGSSGGKGRIELRITVDDKQITLTSSNNLGPNTSGWIASYYIRDENYFPIVWLYKFKIEYRNIVESGTFSFSQSADELCVNYYLPL